MIPKKLLDELNLWITSRRYGNIQINFADGKIVNFNRVESIRISEISTTNDPVMIVDLASNVIMK